MPRIAGIKLHKTSSGKIKAATIDMKKHGEILQPLLHKLGVIESYEDDFERKWATGIPAAEAKERLLNHVRSFPWKK